MKELLATRLITGGQIYLYKLQDGYEVMILYPSTEVTHSFTSYNLARNKYHEVV